MKSNKMKINKMQEYVDEYLQRNKPNLIILIWILNKKDMAFSPLHSIVSKRISDLNMDIIKPYTTQSVSKQLIRILMKLNQAYECLRFEKIKEHGEPKNYFSVIPDTNSAGKRYYLRILQDTINSLEKLYDFTTFRNVLIRIVTKLIALMRCGYTAWSKKTHRYNITMYRYKNVSDEEIVDSIKGLSSTGYIKDAKKHMNIFVHLVKNGYFEQYICYELLAINRYTPTKTKQKLLCLFGIADNRKDAFLKILPNHLKWMSFEDSNFSNIHKEMRELKADMKNIYKELNKIFRKMREYRITSNAEPLKLKNMEHDYTYYNTLLIQKIEDQGLFFINKHGNRCLLPTGSGFLNIIHTEQKLFENNLFKGNKYIKKELECKIKHMKKVLDQLTKN